MTNAMIKKAEKSIAEFRHDHPFESVHDCWFHHYGNDYRIHEIGGVFKIFRHNPYGRIDVEVGEISC